MFLFTVVELKWAKLMELEKLKSGDCVSARKELQLIINTEQILDEKKPTFCLFQLWIRNLEKEFKQFFIDP